MNPFGILNATLSKARWDAQINKTIKIFVSANAEVESSSLSPVNLPLSPTPFPRAASRSIGIKSFVSTDNSFVYPSSWNLWRSGRYAINHRACVRARLFKKKRRRRKSPRISTWWCIDLWAGLISLLELARPLSTRRAAAKIPQIARAHAITGRESPPCANSISPARTRIPRINFKRAKPGSGPPTAGDRLARHANHRRA